MKGDDGTIACIALHVVNNILRCQPFGIVTGNQVPHHNFVFPLQPPVFRVTHPTVWRSEEMRFDQVIGLCRVDGIGNRPVFEGSDMVERVITNLMAFFNNAVVEVVIAKDVLSNHKKRSLGTVLS